MEALSIELVEQLVELCAEEVLGTLISTGCMWSKRKYRKIMKRFHKDKLERSDRITRRMSSPKLSAEDDPVDIWKYVVVLQEENERLRKELTKITQV